MSKLKTFKDYQDFVKSNKVFSMEELFENNLAYFEENDCVGEPYRYLNEIQFNNAITFGYCKSEIEDSEKCTTQCNHCKIYYKPLENKL